MGLHYKYHYSSLRSKIIKKTYMHVMFKHAGKTQLTVRSPVVKISATFIASFFFFGLVILSESDISEDRVMESFQFSFFIKSKQAYKHDLICI